MLTTVLEPSAGAQGGCWPRMHWFWLCAVVHLVNIFEYNQTFVTRNFLQVTNKVKQVGRGGGFFSSEW